MQGGLIGAVGIGAGSLIHTVAVALGIGALLAGLPDALRIVRLAGAAYLVYLAVRCLLRAARGEVSGMRWGSAVVAEPPGAHCAQRAGTRIGAGGRYGNRRRGSSGGPSGRVAACVPMEGSRRDP